MADENTMKNLDKLIEEIEPLLLGIDMTGVDHEEGWWETSTGAHFGAQKKREIKDRIKEAYCQGANDLWQQVKCTFRMNDAVGMMMNSQESIANQFFKSLNQ